ncbi:hypothetical protein SAMN05445504_9138 [Burkholderia sp. CF099]|jgi:hypothetical protein|nr:hypothetical protein SAMN05445504_9138 [Burkholderia sp. CF099]
MTKANRRKRRRQSMPPYESSEQIEARMTAFVLRTREWAINTAKIPFPDDVTVLAGPIRRRRPKSTQPESPGGAPSKRAKEEPET